ncbi:MAG: zinc ribbon domain-containing protein [Candidatus Asgardarchaeia archaeon]
MILTLLSTIEDEAERPSTPNIEENVPKPYDLKRESVEQERTYKEEEHLNKKVFYCPYCGAKIEDDYAYCPECGKKLI